MNPPPSPVRIFFQLAAKVRMSRKCLPRSDSRQCCRPPRQKCTQLRQSCSKSHSRLVRPSLTKDNIFFFCFIYFPFSMYFSFIFMFFSFSAQMYHTALLFSLFSLPTSTQKELRDGVMMTGQFGLERCFSRLYFVHFLFKMHDCVPCRCKINPEK